MKKSLLLLAVFLFSLSSPVFASPGRTDKYGGHTCYTNCSKYGLTKGQYHYHKNGKIVKTAKPTTKIEGSKWSYDTAVKLMGISLAGYKNCTQDGVDFASGVVDLIDNDRMRCDRGLDLFQEFKDAINKCDSVAVLNKVEDSSQNLIKLLESKAKSSYADGYEKYYGGEIVKAFNVFAKALRSVSNNLYDAIDTATVAYRNYCS